jgi:hypothetical protein
MLNDHLDIFQFHIFPLLDNTSKSQSRLVSPDLAATTRHTSNITHLQFSLTSSQKDTPNFYTFVRLVQPRHVVHFTLSCGIRTTLTDITHFIKNLFSLGLDPTPITHLTLKNIHCPLTGPQFSKFLSHFPSLAHLVILHPRDSIVFTQPITLHTLHVDYGRTPVILDRFPMLRYPTVNIGYNMVTLSQSLYFRGNGNIIGSVTVPKFTHYLPVYELEVDNYVPLLGTDRVRKKNPSRNRTRDLAHAVQ